MWEPIGSVKRAKDDGYIHILSSDDFHTTHGNDHHPTTHGTAYTMTIHTCPASSVALAPLEIRDRVYRRLIELSPAWKFERELVTAPRGLLARGFSRSDIRRFGALPARVAERDRLARKISAELEADLPAYAASRHGTAILGVPGFWEGANWLPKLGRVTSYRSPALIIPYRDRQGSIQACQLMFSDKRGQSSYSWLSTAEDKLAAEPRGTSSGSPIHFAFREGQYLPNLPILITEGALKAEAFTAQRPAMRAVATAGVTVAHGELIAATRGQDVAVAFDIDHRQNEKVCRQLAKLIAERAQDAVSAGQKTTTSVVIWDGPKGIDDAALLNGHLRIVSVAQWILTLGNLAEAVADVWRQYEFTPDAEQDERRTSSLERE